MKNDETRDEEVTPARTEFVTGMLQTLEDRMEAEAQERFARHDNSNSLFHAASTYAWGEGVGSTAEVVAQARARREERVTGRQAMLEREAAARIAAAREQEARGIDFCRAKAVTPPPAAATPATGSPFLVTFTNPRLKTVRGGYESSEEEITSPASAELKVRGNHPSPTPQM